MGLYRYLSWITHVISVLILIVIPVYTVSSVPTILAQTDFVTILLNIFLLMIELFGYLFAFYLFYMISSAFQFRYQSIPQYQRSLEHPSFTIIVPSHGTPYSVLKKTLEGTLKIEYSPYDIIVSDNGQDPSVTGQLKEFCEKNQIQFYHKPDTRGFKAGNINAVLDKTSGDFIVILDSDHIPVPNLLTEFSKVISDEKVGYIQAKVLYRNTQRLYQAANSILYSQFYEVFEAAKDQRGVVLFNGTTGCFRKNVLVEVGGFSEETLIEDIDTSMKIISLGYEGRYLDFIGSYGLVPETAKAQVAQLWRWAHGACNILRIRSRSILSSPYIGWKKKFELILNAMAFFSGISIVFLITLLAIMMLFDIPFLRSEVLGFHMGYLMPTLVSISYTLAALLAIIWETREQNLIIRLLQLIPFYLFSLGAFLFIFSGVIEGLLLKNTPLSEKSVWNRDIHAIRNSIIALCLSGILIVIGIFYLSANFSLFVVGGGFSWLLAPIVLLYEELFPPKIEKGHQEA
ncbi:MAG: glycosyltransferase [Candidatus Heimdallarchaeota archaeon]|nr:MAG: glycosyltransferase [Candidatus Heimdallarchaeota archaeon]